MADLGEGPGGMRLGAGAQGLAPSPLLHWVKKKKSQKEEKLAGQAKQNKTTLPLPRLPPLAQGLDPSVIFVAKQSLSDLPITK